MDPTGATPAWPDSYGRVILDEIDSTMREAARRAPHLTGPTWIMARHQTAAHGRRGRPWQSPAGNFAATLLLRPDDPPGRAALRSFSSAVAVYQALSTCIAAERLSLKWPNDVLLDGGKVAGILLESSGYGTRLNWLAIGIGVNLVAAPDIAAVEPRALPPVSLKGQGAQALDAEDLLYRLAVCFAAQEKTFRDFGFDPIRRLWLRHASHLGQVITARTAREEITGTFETVDEAGNLVLVTPESRQAIPAAEVFF